MADLSDPNARQKLMLGVLLLGGLAYFGYTYAYQPRAAEIAAMEERLEALELRNQTVRQLVLSQGRGEVEQQLRLYREQLSRVENLIPSSEELPDLLDAISAEAQRSGVELTLIQPAGAEQEEFYTRRTYDLAVLGSYHQIAEFLTQVGSLPRIVTPINLNVTVQEEETRSGNPRLEARFAIETYVLPSLELPADTANAE
jgi:type IV pilus assembly protein PilO